MAADGKKGSAETLSDRVKRRRAELGLTPTDVARRVRAAGRKSIQIQHIRKLEGKKQRSVTYLAELALALECDPIWLGTGKGRKELPAGIDIEKMTLALDAVETVINEIQIAVSAEEKAGLILGTYDDLGGEGAKPLEVARALVLRLLAQSRRQ